jgi:hypothetical protein
VKKNNSDANDRLNSWKEIAAHLCCDIRTCRRWEITKKLPVHRIGRSEKARIFAYPQELDRWLRKQARNSNGFRQVFHLPSEYRIAAIAVVCILIGVAGFFIINRLSLDRNPAGFRIERSILIVLNQDGRRLWIYDTGIENLAQDSSYRAYTQYKRNFGDGNVEFPWIIIKDIQGDGQNEVLFSIQTQDAANEGLICFDPRGDVLWQFQGGRELRFGPKVYSGDYRIKGFELEDIDGDGAQEVLVISIHDPDWPCQLAILDSQGRMLAEYWNAGYIMDIVFHDLNGDGADEMLLCGVSNEYGRGFFAVFDPARIAGQSPHADGRYRCAELGQGTYTHYVLFPRSDVRKDYPTEAALSIALQDTGRLLFTTDHGGLIYELNPDLTVYYVTYSNTFREMHNAARAAGLIDSVLDEEYRKRQMEGVQYYQAGKWVRSSNEYPERP